MSWREFCWKNLVRFFITPHQQRHYTTNSECWRQCQTDNANHHHIFWSCPALVSFWTNVYHTIQEVLQSTFPFRFDILYLGNFPQEIGPKDRKLVSILLAASKKAITRKWLQQQAPLIDDWFDIIYDIYKMEKLTYFLKLRQDVFVSIWSKWTVYIAPRRVEFI